MFEGEYDDDPHVGALHRAETAAAHAFLAQSDALLALWEDSPQDARTGERPHAVAEAAMALGLHPQTVQHRLSLAEGLRDHLLLRTQLRDGLLHVPHVLVALQETDDLGDPSLAARVLDAVLLTDGRIGWPGTPGDLRRALVRTAIRLDPDGAARRRELKQQMRTCVRLRHRDAGLADWTATGPATALLAADRLLDALSTPAGPDDTRSHGQRQLDALVGALVHRVGGAVPVELELEIPTAITVAAQHRGVDLPEPVRLRSELTPELLQLLSTGRPDSGRPCPEVPGSSMPPPEEPDGASDTTTSATPTSATPTSATPTSATPTSATPTSATPTSATPTSASPTSASPGRATPPAADGADEPGASRPRRTARHRPRQGVPELLDHGPVDPALLAELLADPDGLPVGLGPVTVRRVCVDRHGQVVALDDRARPLARILAEARPGPGRSTTAGRLLRCLLDRLPQPPPVTTGHDPTAVQTRVLRARDPRCTFPGCSHAARRSEADHRVRFPVGPTALCNLQPLCKHHHRLKHDGFHPCRDADGATTWTTPRGQTVTARPW